MEDTEITNSGKKEKSEKLVKPFNSEEFRVKFRAVFALISFILGMVFICFAVFSKTAQTSEFTGTIIGFICGTMITLILTYYFGNADNQPPVPPVENPLIDSSIMPVRPSNYYADKMMK